MTRIKSIQLPLFFDGPLTPTMRIFGCEQCGTMFSRAQSWVAMAAKKGQRARFCSKACQGRHTHQHHVGEGMRFACEQCGTAFYRKPATVRRAGKRGCGNRYCSKACMVAAKTRITVERTCEACQATFSVPATHVARGDREGFRAGRYCSAACFNPFHSQEKRTRIQLPCTGCGVPILRSPARIRDRNFCSALCMGTMVPGWTRSSAAKAGYRADIAHAVRSRWEANFSRILLAMGIAYNYEPKAFRLGPVSYIPDFWVPAWSCWIEVKGWMRPAAEAKIAAFRDAYPNQRLVVIDAPVYRAMAREWADRLPAWEA